MILSDIAIRRPVFTTMVTVGMMTLGVIASRFLGVDLFPDVSFPIVVVTTVYPGAGPEEVEQQVTKPLEDAVSSINGLDDLRSFSRDSVSFLIAQFKLETDIKLAANDVRDKVAAARLLLPRDVRDPKIQRLDPTAFPVLTYTVSTRRGPAQTRALVDDLIKPSLEALDGVGQVTVTGGLERELHVYVDRARLEALGLTLALVAQQLGSESFDLPAGRVTTAATEVNVKTQGRLRSVEELGAMVVASLPSGAQVLLREVARIEDGFKEVRSLPFLDGRDAVVFDVQKQGGANQVAVADRVKQALDRLAPTLPPDVEMAKVIDGSSFIRQNIHDVTEAIVFGGIMAILVIFLFMLDWRSTVISSLALPTSVVTTFFVMWWMGFSFNLMTLLGLSLAIGLLIDDAVVVRENIFRHMEMGQDPITAARRATAQIGLAVMATTFTIVAVFVPVAFMGGLIGKMFREFGLTVAAAVLVSLFVSFTLDPMMSARVMKPITPGHHERQRRHRAFGPVVRMFDRLDAYYRGVLRWALAHRGAVVAATTALFVGSLALVPMMGKEFFSPGDRGEFRISLEMPAGTSLDEMVRVTRQVEALVRQNDQVRTIYTTVGPGDEANKAAVRVYTTKKWERKVSQWAIQDDLRARMAAVPGLKYDIADLGMMEAANAERFVTLYVRGDDYAELQRVAVEAAEAVRSTRGTKDADVSYRPGKPEATLLPDRARAADLGVSVGVVAATVRLALEGEVVAKYREGDRDYDVRLHLAPEERARLGTLLDLTVPATGRRLGAPPPMGLAAFAQGPRLVRVGDVATLARGTGPATIERMNRQRQIIVTANIADRSLGDITEEIDAKLARIAKPASFRFEWGGPTKNMRDTFKNMLAALVVAVLFIYFVLASQFESFVHPLTIMLALPLAIIGALLMLFMTANPIGMPSLIGIILLMGLVTKNGILLVDRANQLRAQGAGVEDALLEAGPVRLRPILMTSLAMILGMLPTALARGEGSEFRSPMSVAVIGGVITSTLLTLVVVPVVYTWVDRFTLRGARRSAATVDVAAAGAQAGGEAPHPPAAAARVGRWSTEDA